MSRRTARPRPHLYQEDQANPGTCGRCHLIERNEAHVDELPTTDPAAAELDARRLGERDEKP